MSRAGDPQRSGSRVWALPIPRFWQLLLVIAAAGLGWVAWSAMQEARLRRLLRDPQASPTERVQAVEAWAARGAAGVDELAGALSHADRRVRRDAARALSRIGPAARGAVPALERVLADADVQVRLQAVSALGRIDYDLQRLTPVLAERLIDEDPSVREAASELLWRVGPA